METGGPYWTPGVSLMLTDMFLDMPAVTKSPRLGVDRRSSERLSRDLVLGAGLVLKDQSATGARLVIEGVAPKPGSAFVYALDTGSLTGIVRWAQQLEGGSTLFGVELEESPVSV